MKMMIRKKTTDGKMARLVIFNFSSKFLFWRNSILQNFAFVHFKILLYYNADFSLSLRFMDCLSLNAD